MGDLYEKIGAAQPAVKEHADAVKDYSARKLYHQLLETAHTLLSEMQDVDLAMQVFTQDIKPIGEKLNPVRYMEVVGVILRRCLVSKTGDERLEFVAENFGPFDLLKDDDAGDSGKDKDGDAKMGDSNNQQPAGGLFQQKKVGNLSHYSKASESDFQDAKALFLSFKSQILVEGKKLELAKDVMDELEVQLFKKRPTVNIKPKVFSWFYKAQVKLYSALDNYSALYRAGVNYLLYTPLEKAANEDFDLKKLAVDMGIACLVSEEEYFFGELLDLELFKQPEVKSLWISELVYAFQEGKFELYDAAMKKHSAEIAKFSIFKQKESIIYEKFCSSVLMEFAFQQPKNKRKISLAELAKNIRVKDIETLLINAMCANLIKGSIDEVDGTFTYTWVRPRVLDVGRLKVLEDRVTQWVDQQTAVLKQVEELTPDLLVTV